MVVEDEPEIYELLLAMFEMWGIEGVAFVDGEEAVAWIEDVDHSRFQGELPELALLDIRLPGEINGIQVGEHLRKSPILRKVAIVMTTAFKLTETEKAEAMKQTQADLWLPKPLPKFKELQSILEKVIAERHSKNQIEQLKPSDAESDETPEPTSDEVPEPASDDLSESITDEIPVTNVDEVPDETTETVTAEITETTSDEKPDTVPDEVQTSEKKQDN
jgi:CheY-like chemotaxis protein